MWIIILIKFKTYTYEIHCRFKYVLLKNISLYNSFIMQFYKCSTICYFRYCCVAISATMCHMFVCVCHCVHALAAIFNSQQLHQHHLNKFISARRPHQTKKSYITTQRIVLLFRKHNYIIDVQYNNMLLRSNKTVCERINYLISKVNNLDNLQKYKMF